MISLAKEVRNIQNPALGAAILWRFVCGYVENHATHEAAPFPLLFVVLPIVLHQQTEEFVSGTQKATGLRGFAGKFGKSEHSKQDLLLNIDDRAFSLRTLTLDSVRVAILGHLLHVENASLIPVSTTPARSGMGPDIRRIMGSAEKLGAWCGSLTLHEISIILRVRF